MGAIIVNLDVMMAKRKLSLNELSERVGISLSNLSILKTGKAKAIRFSTLEALCEALNCQPGDILEFEKDILKDKWGWDKWHHTFLMTFVPPHLFKMVFRPFCSISWAHSQYCSHCLRRGAVGSSPLWGWKCADVPAQMPIPYQIDRIRNSWILGY